jgi:hypothetical protein
VFFRKSGNVQNLFLKFFALIERKKIKFEEGANIYKTQITAYPAGDIFVPVK